MAEIPQPPTMTKKDLADLNAYHVKMADFMKALTDALAAITFKDNLGALITEPTAVEVSGSGDFGVNGIEVPCTFEPQLVIAKASKVDTNGRTTGEVFNTCVSWRTGTKQAASGFTALGGSYLSAARYLVTIIAFPG